MAPPHAPSKQAADILTAVFKTVRQKINEADRLGVTTEDFVDTLLQAINGKKLTMTVTQDADSDSDSDDAKVKDMAAITTTFVASSQETTPLKPAPTNPTTAAFHAVDHTNPEVFDIVQSGKCCGYIVVAEHARADAPGTTLFNSASTALGSSVGSKAFEITYNGKNFGHVIVPA